MSTLRTLTRLRSPHQIPGLLKRRGHADEDSFCGYLELALASIAASAGEFDTAMLDGVHWIDFWLDCAADYTGFAALVENLWKESHLLPHVATCTRSSVPAEQITIFSQALGSDAD